METITESHTWSKGREQLIVGYPVPTDTFTVQPPALRLSTRVMTLHCVRFWERLQ